MMAAAATVMKMSPSPSSIEKRGSPRRRVLKGAFISFNDRHCDFPCTVRDISDTGARLVVKDGVNIPSRFELIVELDGMEADCEVVWREINAIGVQFVARPRKGLPSRIQVIGKHSSSPLPGSTLRRKPIAA